MKNYNQKPMMSYKTKLYRFIRDSEYNEYLTRKEITFLEGLYGMMNAGTYHKFVTKQQESWMETIFNNRKKAIN